MEFKKLGELVEVYDSLHKTPKEYTDEGYPMVRVKDVDKGFLNLNGTSKVSYEVYEEFSKKYKPKKGDIIFSRVGSYGIPCYINTEESFCLGQNTVILHPIGISSEFLYYCLNSPFVQNQIHKFATGSTQKTISLKSIKELEIPFPSLKSQEQIGKMLFGMDLKIEMNSNIISKLDEISTNLFKRWFIDFEFPDEQGLPYRSSGGEMVESELGEIPKGWEVERLEFIASFKNGKKIVDDKRDTNGKNKIYGSNGIIGFTNEVLQQNPSIVIGRVGANCGSIQTSMQPCWITDNAIICVPKDIKYYGFLYEVLSRAELRTKAGGSAQPLINQTILNNIGFILPEDKVIQNFHEVTYKNLLMIEELSSENEKLVQLRDTLLPKLLSGEIEIPDESVVEPS